MSTKKTAKPKATKTSKAAGAEAPAAPVPVVVVPPEVPKPEQPDIPAEPRPPEPPKPSKPIKGLTPDEEIAEIEKRIASDQARLEQLRNPFQEYPKMVNGVTFNSLKEHEAAGSDFAEGK